MIYTPHSVTHPAELGPTFHPVSLGSLIGDITVIQYTDV